MIIRRISYFTFMVAITTMATVSSCQKAHAASISAEDFNTIIAALSEHEIFDFSFQYENTSESYNVRLQQLLKAKGLKAGTFQIKAAAPGKENVLNLILVVDKNYKGTVASSMFDNPAGYFAIPACTVNNQSDKPSFSSFTADIRKDIERKNLILLI
jgi:hypothetical protein